MKTALIITILLLHAIFAAAQLNSFFVSGFVSDSASKEKMGNTTVILKIKGDSLSRSTITDTNGNFRFDNLKAAKCILYISHVGFIPFSKEIDLIKNEAISITLVKANTTLADVNIFSEKKLVTHTADKVIYNLAEGAVTSSDNLYNIILKVPGVSESNNTLFYQGKPLSILLDGKSNNLSGEDLKTYLSSFLGTNTDKLEVLLNPSSKYDAQGGAVFNIKSVKNKNYGLTKTIIIGIGTGIYVRYPLGFALNYRNKKMNIYGGYDFNHNQQVFHLDALLSFANNASIDLMDHDVRTRDNHSLRLGVDYDLSKNTAIGFLFKGLQNYRHRVVKNISIYTPGINLPDTVATVSTIGDSKYIIPSLNIFFKKQLSKTGSELAINLDYFDYRKEWNDDFISDYFNRSGNKIAPTNYLLDRSPAHNRVKSFTADYLHPYKNGKLEAGLKLTESKTDNNVLWQQLVNNNWETDQLKTNHFIYKEDVYASYINISKSYRKLAIQAGLRYEATRSNAISVTIHKITANEYNNLFPTISLQYKAEKSQLLISYRKSIRRFGFDVINPFVIIQSQYSYHQGNPYIKPSFFNSIDLSWNYKNKLSVGAGYSAVKDPMSYAYKKDNGSNISVGTFLNFKSGRLYNSSLNYTEKIFRGKWTSINSVGFLHCELPDFNSHIQHNNSYTLNTVNTIALPAKISMELSAFFNSPILDGTILQGVFYATSIGFSKPVLKSKGSFKLSCVDVFNTQIVHNNTDGGGIKINAYWKPETRFANLLFTYRFGNLNVKANKNRKTGIEDEKNRMGAN